MISFGRCFHICNFICSNMSYSRARERRATIRKNILLLLFPGLATIVTVYYVKLSDDFYSDPVIMRFNLGDNNISCHYSQENDALPSADDPEFSPRPNSIFFHETSCSGGLNSRQACAVESAARAHPRRKVYVLFSGPISKYVLKKSVISKLEKIPNIKLARVHIAEYAKKTPLDELILTNPFNESKWRVEHTSDVLRYLTLYKFGGVYLDTDVMVVKSLTTLGHNWVAKQDDTEVNAAALAISMDHLGRKLAGALINEIKNTYRPDIWAHNGPGAITRVLGKMCFPAQFAEWTAKTCQGLEVYEPEYFYPIRYPDNALYFEPGHPDLLKAFDNAYTHHFWNKLSHDRRIYSESVYAIKAKEYCPTVYEMYGDQFGS